MLHTGNLYMLFLLDAESMLHISEVTSRGLGYYLDELEELGLVQWRDMYLELSISGQELAIRLKEAANMSV